MNDRNFDKNYLEVSQTFILVKEVPRHLKMFINLSSFSSFLHNLKINRWSRGSYTFLIYNVVIVLIHKDDWIYVGRVNIKKERRHVFKWRKPSN